MAYEKRSGRGAAPGRAGRRAARSSAGPRGRSPAAARGSARRRGGTCTSSSSRRTIRTTSAGCQPRRQAAATNSWPRRCSSASARRVGGEEGGAGVEAASPSAYRAAQTPGRSPIPSCQRKGCPSGGRALRSPGAGLVCPARVRPRSLPGPAPHHRARSLLDGDPQAPTVAASVLREPPALVGPLPPPAEKATPCGRVRIGDGGAPVAPYRRLSTAVDSAAPVSLRLTHGDQPEHHVIRTSRRTHRGHQEGPRGAPRTARGRGDRRRSPR